MHTLQSAKHAGAQAVCAMSLGSSAATVRYTTSSRLKCLVLSRTVAHFLSGCLMEASIEAFIMATSSTPKHQYDVTAEFLGTMSERSPQPDDFGVELIAMLKTPIMSPSGRCEALASMRLDALLT